MTIPDRTRRQSAIAVGLALVLFGGGLTVGIAASHLWMHAHRVHHGPPGKGRKLEVFRERLHLSDGQADAIEQIFDETMDEMKELHERSQARIREQLNEDQRAEFDRMIQHEHQRRHGP